MRQRTQKRFAPRVDPHGTSRGTRALQTGSFWNRGNRTCKVTSRDATLIFGNLATLLENGVSLPKALGALAEERSLESCRDMLHNVRQRVESGDTFSSSLADQHGSFNVITVNQIKVGERAGTLGETLGSIAEQLQKSGRLRAEIVKKLSYPAILTLVGCGVITFLLTYVVPVFEETYRSAKVPLPGITQTLVLVGAIARSYGWLLLVVGVFVVVILQRLRKQDSVARAIDVRLMQLPVLGPWIRDIAVLELMEVLGDLMEAGFTLVEALSEAAATVSNRAMQTSVRELHAAVSRGEKFSREMERHRDLFPPIVSQLVIVGEQTGKLTKATRHIRVHLSDEIERKTNVFVGVIEPTLTIALSAAVAVVLLAIYLPMFDMINTIGK